MDKTKTNVSPKYQVPDQTKARVREFMEDFLKKQDISKSALARLMQDKLGRSGSKSSLMDKFARASFQLSEVMEILDLFGGELKIIQKEPIEGFENKH